MQGICQLTVVQPRAPSLPLPPVYPSTIFGYESHSQAGLARAARSSQEKPSFSPVYVDREGSMHVLSRLKVSHLQYKISPGLKDLFQDVYIVLDSFSEFYLVDLGTSASESLTWSMYFSKSSFSCFRFMFWGTTAIDAREELEELDEERDL